MIDKSVATNHNNWIKIYLQLLESSLLKSDPDLMSIGLKPLSGIGPKTEHDFFYSWDSKVCIQANSTYVV